MGELFGGDPSASIVVTTPAPPSSAETHVLKVGNVNPRESPPTRDYTTTSSVMWHTMGFHFRIDGLQSGGGIFKVQRFSSTQWQLKVTTSGALELYDANNVLKKTVASVISINTWYRIEVKWRHFETGPFKLWVDDILKMDLANIDTRFFYGKIRMRFTNTTNPGFAINTYFANWYWFRDNGASITTNDARLGDYDVVPILNTTQLLSDYGDDPSAGDWKDACQVDFDSATHADFNPGDGLTLNGGITANDSAFSGPNGNSNVNGTIKGVLFLWLYFADATFSDFFSGDMLLWGKYGGTPVGSPTVDNTGLLSLPWSFQAEKFGTIWLEASDANAPQANEYAQMGWKEQHIENQADSQVRGMGCYLLHKRPAPSVELDWYTPYILNRKKPRKKFSQFDFIDEEPIPVIEDELDWYINYHRKHNKLGLKFSFFNFIGDHSNRVALTFYDRQNKIPYAGRLITIDHTDLSETYGSPLGILNLIANRIYYIPYNIPYLVFAKTLQIIVLTPVVGAIVRVGIFKNERGKIGELVTSNIIQPDSLAVESIPIIALLHAGVYWLAITTDNAAVGFRKQTIRTETKLPYDSPDLITDYTHRYNDSSNFLDESTTVLGSGDIPVISIGY